MLRVLYRQPVSFSTARAAKESAEWIKNPNRGHGFFVKKPRRTLVKATASGIVFRRQFTAHFQKGFSMTGNLVPPIPHAARTAERLRHG